ncbi:hypothetical protein R0K17_02825 [Planococcus sp. SIMBA_143]
MDLNDLIMTIVTATAALIAVIGGFLISRVITLASEQTGIRRKLAESRSDIMHKRLFLLELKEEVLAEDGDEFVQEFYQKIIFEEKTVEQILEEEDYKERKPKELAPYVTELANVYKDLYELTNSNVIVDDDFSKFSKSVTLQYPKRKQWYELLYEEMKKMKEDENQRRGRSVMRYVTSQPIVSVKSEQKKEEIKEVAQTIKILRIQHREQEKVLKDYGKPQGLWWGLLVLFYAAVVGIAYPASLLPYPQNFYNDAATKILILCLFYSHLIALFIYLGIYMHKLTKAEPTLPLDLDINNATSEEMSRHVKEDRRLFDEYMYEKRRGN